MTWQPSKRNDGRPSPSPNPHSRSNPDTHPNSQASSQSPPPVGQNLSHHSRSSSASSRLVCADSLHYFGPTHLSTHTYINIQNTVRRLNNPTTLTPSLACTQTFGLVFLRPSPSRPPTYLHRHQIHTLLLLLAQKVRWTSLSRRNAMPREWGTE